MKTFKVLSAFVFAFIVFSACSGVGQFRARKKRTLSRMVKKYHS